ncbi:MAG: MFS transporter [Candidatus Bipolaricaulis sp.]|nr:MFS transporter [Candidatus Bipolaricaulis sp.]
MAPRERCRILLSTTVYFALYALVGVLSGAVGPTLGPFAGQVGVGLSAIGIILTARSLGYLVGALGSSRWADRVPIHRGIAAAALLAAAFLAVLPWVRSLGLLALALVPIGFATACSDVGVSTMLLRIYRNRAAPFLSALHFFYGVGGLAAPFLVAALAVGREALVYPLLAAGFALLAIALFLLPEERATSVQAKERPTRLGGRFIAATSVLLVYVGAEVGFASWLYVFVDLQLGGTAATAVTGAFWAAFSLFRLAAIPAARRWSPERILTGSFAGGLAFALVLLLGSRILSAVWIGAVGFGAAVAPIYPSVVTAYSHRYELTGRRFGAIAVASCTGSMTIPWLIGRLIDVGGPVVVPAITAGLLATAGMAAWVVFGGRRRAASA